MDIGPPHTRAQPSVAWYPQEVFEELGFEHCLSVDGFSSRAFPVVEVLERVADVSGVDGV